MNLIYNLFKKKNRDYQPVNRLEQLFIAAGDDPSKRPEFYRTIFHFQLFCLGEVITETSGAQTIRFRTEKMDNQDMVYAFTSEEALNWFVRRQKSSQQSFVGIDSHALFEMIQGKMGIILNAGHVCTTVLSPSEVGSIVSDFKLEDHTVSSPAGETFQIGQPADMPVTLVKSLAEYSKNSPKLKEIYFGLLVDQNHDQRFVGVLEFVENITESDEGRVFEDLVTVSQETMPRNKIIDFCDLKKSSFQQAVQEGALKSVSSF